MKAIIFSGKIRLALQHKCATLLFLSILSLNTQAFADPVAVQAVSTNALVNSFGINTRLMNQFYGNAYTDPVRAASYLSFIGFRYARDCFCDNYGLAAMKTVNAYTGVKFNILIHGGNLYTPAMNMLRANANLVEEVEGANEADHFSQYWQGLTGIPAAVAQQKKLWQDIKGNPSLSHIKVNSFTLTQTTSLTHIADAGSYADFSASHIYPLWGGSIGESTVPYLTYLTNAFKPMANGKQPVITEGGWWTSPAGMGVPEDVHAKYTMNFLLSAYKLGVRRTYLYQLFDEYCDPAGTDMEMHFGLFKCDGTAKWAAFALHNLTTLLADAGNSTPGTLSYAVTGMPTTGQQLLMQKSDGTFVLALWNDAKIWNNTTHQPRAVANVQVMLNLGAQASNITVYDPYSSLAAVQTQTNLSGMTLNLPDHPILVFITPAPPPAPTPDPTPTPTTPTPTTGITVTPAPAPAPPTPPVVSPEPETVATTTVLQNLVPAVTAKRGAKAKISYRWNGVPMPRSYRIFVYYISPLGTIGWTDNFYPTRGTSKWNGLTQITHMVQVPPKAAKGTYRILTGMFYPGIAGTVRLVAGSGVTELGGYQFQVGTLTVN